MERDGLRRCRQPLATSATRQYKVDATAPFIKKFAPDLDELKAKSTIKATFSEKVRGISGKSIKMYKAKGKKWVKIKVKIKALKKGKVASHQTEGPPEGRRLPDPLLHEADQGRPRQQPGAQQRRVDDKRQGPDGSPRGARRSGRVVARQ